MNKGNINSHNNQPEPECANECAEAAVGQYAEWYTSTESRNLKFVETDPEQASSSVLLSDIPKRVHPVIFESITSKVIRTSMSQTKSRLGPSGLNQNV